MRRFTAPLFALALIAVALGLRWPHLDREVWNLDEGSTFTMGQQILAGDVLYRDAADNRSPLLPYLKAAIFAVAGDWNGRAVHVVLAFTMAGCAILLWRTARRLGDEIAGVAAAIVFTVISFAYLDPWDALSASTGWAVAVCSTGGFALLVWALDRPGFGRGLWSGLSFGASIACKQPAGLDLAAACLVLAVVVFRVPRGDLYRWLRTAAGLLLGALLPMTGFVLYYIAKGAFADFVYYAFTFNTKLYIPEVPPLQRWAVMAQPFELAWHHVPEVLALGVVGGILGLAVILPNRRERQPGSILPWLFLSWTAAGVLSTGLSGRTFSHYSAQLAPGLALACGWTVSRLLKVARNRDRAWVVRTGAYAVLGIAALGLVRDCVKRHRELPGDDPQGPAVGRFISAFTNKSDRIFVWGYFPELYYFSHRLPATRFIYTNYVTGMIAWTNLDPLVDTTYGMTPDAWGQLEEDLKRHPPALIVDTGGGRGYLKYPFHEQVLLHDLVQRDYAEVAVAKLPTDDMHLFRRVESRPTATLDAALPINRAIHVSGLRRFRRNQPPRVLVQAPAGATRIELYAGTQLVAALNHPIAQPVAVAFAVDSDRSGAEQIRAVIVTASNRSVSDPFDFFNYAGRVMLEPLPGPRLQIEELRLAPVAEDRPIGGMAPSALYPDTWRLDAPVTLEYRCPPDLRRVSFMHGPYPETQGNSDGYDLQVLMQEQGRKPVVVHQHRLLPLTVAADRLPQRVELPLPPHQEARLIFRFLAGAQNQANFDWIYFGQLVANTDGPVLLMGNRPVFPISGYSAGQERMKQHMGGNWIAHAPARVEWIRPPELTAMTLRYGMDDASYTTQGEHSDGTDFTLELVEPDGTAHRLFRRELAPFNHPEDRGPQMTRVELPPKLAGNLVLTVGPGARGDASWDWAYLGEILCEGPGPNIIIDGHRALMPISSHTQNAEGPPSKYDGDNRWGAHADAELVFERPADLTRVTFEYGLADGAARGENGKRRSDGVEVVVEFASPGEPAQEIFRRHLDPFADPADAGIQRSTIELPRYRAGRLVFRLTPGAAGSQAFDWGYWGRFSGEIIP